MKYLKMNIIILQNKIDKITELSTNEEEVQKLSGLMKLSSGENEQLRQDKLYFLTTYTNSKTSMKEFKENYGLNNLDHHLIGVKNISNFVF